MPLDQKYWSQRYQENNTPWDLGDVSPPLRKYIDSLTDKSLRILIPGAGRAYEALYLFQKGFTNVYICDWAEEALEAVRTNQPDFPKENLICSDFFQLNNEFDLIIEQTFFCAISPDRRGEYVKKTAELLATNGTLTGLFFAREFPFKGPPFGGNELEYRELFSPLFEIKSMDVSEDSISPRLGE